MILCRNSNKIIKKGTNLCEYFEFGAVQRCVNLVDLEKFCKMSTVFGCKNRPRYRRERAGYIVISWLKNAEFYGIESFSLGSARSSWPRSRSATTSWSSWRRARRGSAPKPADRRRSVDCAVRAVAERRVAATAACTPDDRARLFEDDLERGAVRATVRAVTQRVARAALATTPSVLAGLAMVDERALDDTSGRLRTRVSHAPVLQPPGGRVATRYQAMVHTEDASAQPPERWPRVSGIFG